MLKATLFALTALLFFAGCSQHQPAAPAPAAVKAVSIEGITWKLSSFGDHDTPVPDNAWIRLNGGRYEGFAGCNGLSGTYDIEGSHIRFTMDPHTMKVCADIKGENLLRRRLLETDRYAMEEGLLVFSKGSKRLLVFMK
ncbi:META domain-containing protein [Hydrogenimonas sp.]